MLRFVGWLTGAIVLAAAVVFAVADIARSLADEALRLTPLDEALNYFGFAAPAAVEPGVLADLREGVMGLPASVLLAALAFVILLAARPRRRRHQSRGLR